jgi:hypothetical protein
MLTVQEIEALCAVAGLELVIYKSGGWYTVGIWRAGGKYIAGSGSRGLHNSHNTPEHAANAAWNNYIKENT